MSGQSDPLMRALELFQSARLQDREYTLGGIVDQVVASDPSARGQRPRLLRELIKLDLEYRCHECDRALEPESGASPDRDSPSGRQSVRDIPLLEAYLTASTDVSFGDDSLLELIEHEYCVRYHSQQPLDMQSYRERFPQLGETALQRLQNLREDLAVESSLRSFWNQPDPFDDSSNGGFLDDEVIAIRMQPRDLDESLVMDALNHVEPFSKLTKVVRQAVAEKVVLKPFEAGDVLLRQGEVADSLLIVLDGLAEVTVEEAGRVHSIARLGRNTVVGEMGLFTHEVRSANVVAVRAGCAGILSREDFERLAGRYKRLNVAISELIADRVGTLAIDCLCGKHVDRYLIKHRIGRGAMGIVYAALDETHDRLVALKMLRHDLNFDPIATLRFHQEFEIVQGLDHPNIVRVFDEFSAFGTEFICMELCDGIPLSDLVRRAGALPAEAVRSIAGQIAGGLLRARQEGIAHRDLKPANVLLTNDGLAKLADFGLARSLLDESGLTQIGQIVGTPRYMAPEQLRGERGDDRSDLFALGCIVYELLTGAHLFRARRFEELITERLKWSMPDPGDMPVANLDPGIYALIDGCLREDPRQRNIDLEQIARWGSPVEWSALCNATGQIVGTDEPPDTVHNGATRLS